MIGRDASIDRALRQFADAVTTKRARLPAGAPEDQLRGPFENLLSGVAAALGWNIVCTGETPLPDRLGCPDYAVHNDGLLAGYVELKAPGTGADARRFKGRNLRQFRRFSAVPNLLYGDGGEWALYRGGERIGNVVRLSGDIARDGGKAVAPGMRAPSSACCATSCHGGRCCRWTAPAGSTSGVWPRSWPRFAGCCATT